MKQLRGTTTSRLARTLAVALGLGLAGLAPVAATADAPVIGGFNTTRAPLGCCAIIYGSNFGEVQGQSYVLVGGRQVPVLAWSGQAISVLVNPQAYDSSAFTMDAAYPVQVVVPSNSTPTSNAMNLMVTSDPMVFGFDDTTVTPNQTIQIYGVRFGETMGNGTLMLTPASDNPLLPHPQYAVPVMAWSDSVIVGQLTLPDNIPPGLYTLTVQRDDGMTAVGTFTVAIQ